jgi:hypothetical protein
LFVAAADQPRLDGAAALPRSMGAVNPLSLPLEVLRNIFMEVLRNVRNAIYDKLQPYSINHYVPGIYCPYHVYDGLIKPRLLDSGWTQRDDGKLSVRLRSLFVSKLTPHSAPTLM